MDVTVTINEPLRDQCTITDDSREIFEVSPSEIAVSQAKALLDKLHFGNQLNIVNRGSIS